MVLMQVPSSQDTSSDVQLTCPAARGEEGLTASKTYKSVCVCVSVDVRRLCAGVYRGQNLNHRVIQPLGSPLILFLWGNSVQSLAGTTFRSGDLAEKAIDIRGPSRIWTLRGGS